MSLEFENVTYTHYTESLGRAVIPDEDAFNTYATEAKLYVDCLYRDGFIAQIEDGGFDNATCMIAEELYKASLVQNAGGEALASESVGEYSYTVASATQAQRQDALQKAKLKWLRLYCYLALGVR